MMVVATSTASFAKTGNDKVLIQQIYKSMLQLLGSQLGFILVLIIGVVILCIVDKFKRNKMSN